MGRKIKVLSFDNGSKYKLNNFTEFWVDFGIKRELIVPYNPQQNGVSRGIIEPLLG